MTMDRRSASPPRRAFLRRHRRGRAWRAALVAGTLAITLAACEDDSGRSTRSASGDPPGGVPPGGVPPFTDACTVVDETLAICAASDMARVTRDGPIPLEHPRYDIARGPLELRAARDETLGFQLVLRRLDARAPDTLRVDAAAWRANGGAPAPSIHEDVFAAHYVAIGNGAYTSGPDSDVLPTPASYPDALVPRERPCAGTATGPAADATLFERIALPAPGLNQAIWIDLHVAADTAPGRYTREFVLELGERRVTLPVRLDVVAATLPAKPSIDAVGEIYRPYAFEGIGRDPGSPAWQAMARCYQQLAHRHRLVFVERAGDVPSGATLADYAHTYAPALSGELFTEAAGYDGPGRNTPVAVWRTPWRQAIDGTVASALPDREVARYRDLARDWTALAARQGWRDTRWFAYVFDEVDGPRQGWPDSAPRGEGAMPTDVAAREGYLARVHESMRRVQRALDEGAPNDPIDLLWTSHSNPSIWTDDAALDLTDTIRLWAPNAHAADTDFLAGREAAGERTWFYHSGHPAIGAHAINLTGIDMRTWGVAAARYGRRGQLMWAVNFGSAIDPYADPTWNTDDDRVGNGLMVYPGDRLVDIGYPVSPGPVPSMRLKAWRRGLQDAELYLLARERDPVGADRLIATLVPRAFTDAVEADDATPAWARDPADWIDFRDRLLDLLDG